MEGWKQIANHNLSEVKREMALHWLKSFLVVVTRQLSCVMLAQGSHRQCGVGTAVPAQQHRGSVSGRGWCPHCLWEWREGPVHACVNRGKGEGNTRESKLVFFFLTPAGREEGFSTVEKAEVRAQVTDGLSGLVGISIRVSDELVWMFLKEGGVPEDGELFLAHAYLSTCCFPLGEARFFLGLDPYRTSC